MTAPKPEPATQPYRRMELLPAEFFQSTRARAAMGARDVRAVYAALARLGVSQRRIAALTGQSQSEVSEIRAGRRVQAVEVIERIADGLGTPRGWWGLAHTNDAIPPEPAPPAERSRPPSMPASPVVPKPHTEMSGDLAHHLVGLISALRAVLAPDLRTGDGGEH